MVHAEQMQPAQNTPTSPVMVSAAPPGTKQVDLPAIFAVVRRRKMTFFICIAAMVLGVLAFRVVVPPKYTAVTQIMIDPRGLQVVDKDVNPQVGSNTDSFAVLETQGRVMTSDEVLNRVVKKENLATDIEFGAKPPSLLSSIKSAVTGPIKAIVGASPKAPVPPELKALWILRDAVSADPKKNSFVIGLSVKTEDAEKSVRIAQTLSNAYLDAESNARSSTTSTVADSLSKRLDELRQRVTDAEDKAAAFARQNNIVRTGSGEQLLDEQQLVQLSEQLAQAQSRVSEARARFEQIARLKKGNASIDSVTEAVQSSVITQLRTQLATARQREATLANTLSDRHPNLIAARTQTQVVVNQINAELARVVDSARTELERAEQNERELAEKLKDETAKTSVVNQKLVQLRELERDAQANRTVYEAFLVRAREVGEFNSFNPAIARIISPPTLPEKPAGPSLPVLLILALVVGTAMGAAAAYIQEQFADGPGGAADDDNSRTAQQDTTQKQNQVKTTPVLATLPMRSAGMPVSSNIPLLDEPTLNAVTYHQPQSPAAMQMQNLYAGLRGGQGGRRSVLVAGCASPAGRSAVALNLAIAAAAAGERVLLIDADMHNQTLTRTSRLASRPGLPEVLTGRVKLANAARQINGLPLSLVSAMPLSGGSIQPDPILVRDGIVNAAVPFDFMVVDGSRLGADPWMKAFSQIVDEILLSVDHKADSQADVDNAVSMLQADGRQPRGIVVAQG